MEFIPQTSTIGFNPSTIKGTANAQAREAQRQASYDNEYLRSVMSANEQKVRNAEQRARDMVALGELSQTLLKQGTEVLKTINQEREYNKTFDALFSDANSTISTPDEVQEDRELDELSTATTEAALEVEENTGSAALGEAVATQTPGGQVATAYNNQRASLSQAQIGYGSFVNQYLNSDATMTIEGQSMPIRSAIASGDPSLTAAALASARGAFYREYGLDRFSQRQVVRQLGNTILNTDNQLLSSYTNASIKAQRAEAKSQVQSNAYLAGQESADLGGSFRSLADTAFSTGAYASRGDANTETLKAMLRGLAANGDVDGIAELEGELKIEGNQGTALGRQYPELFDKARAEAEKAEEDIISGGVEDIEAGMYRDLKGAASKEERDAIIEAAAEALESQGSYEEARELRQDRDDLVVDGSADYNAARIEDRIRSGEITSSSQIEEERLLGNISDEDAKDLKGMLRTSQGAEKPGNKVAADIASDWTRRAESDLSVVFGLKKDAFGNYVAEGSMSVGEAELIYGAVGREVNMVVNDLIEKNPGLANDPIRLQQQVGVELKNWYNDNFLTKGGKYFIGDIQDNANADEYQDLTPEQLQRFRDIANSPVYLATPRPSSSSLSAPRNLINIRQSPGGFTPEQAVNFNPLRGDRVFTRSETELLKQDFEDGIVQRFLSNTAQQLGLSPAALLQQQLNSYGLGALRVPADSRRNGGTGDFQTNPVDGARQLMSVGFPKNGAAYLAGTIQAESSWRLRRPVWDEVQDDGSDRNGGAISWMDDAEKNHYRLSRVEEYLGKPITEATNIEQMRCIRWELSTYYPEQFRILNNPFSTPRQLRRAIKRYVGYPERNVGARFTDAERILRQL